MMTAVRNLRRPSYVIGEVLATEDEDWDSKSLTSLSIRMGSTRNNSGVVGSTPLESIQSKP